MDTYKVKPLEEPMEVCVQVPGSKSMTNRALLLAAMGEGDFCYTEFNLVRIPCIFLQPYRI